MAAELAVDPHGVDPRIKAVYAYMGDRNWLQVKMQWREVEDIHPRDRIYVEDVGWFTVRLKTTKGTGCVVFDLEPRPDIALEQSPVYAPGQKVYWLSSVRERFNPPEPPLRVVTYDEAWRF